MPLEQLTLWRADVAEQRQVVALAQTEYERACEALEQCSPGGAGWGELRRQQRYLEHHLEAETRKLAQYEQFVTLIEQGATKDEACAAVLGQQNEAAPAEQATSGDAPVKRAAEEVAAAEVQARAWPCLEGQALRRALFATLARNGDPRHMDLERGKFNKAIKNFIFAGL